MKKGLSISYKICIALWTGVIIAALSMGLTTYVGRTQTSLIENIHYNNVIPLDNLRRMELYFREIEFRLVGSISGIVSTNAAANHLERALKEITALWNSVKSGITDTGEIETFEKGLEGLLSLESGIKQAYNDDELEKLEGLYDRWLDYKPLIYKSINKLSDIQKDSVQSSYDQSKLLLARMNKFILIVSLSVILIFIIFSVKIVNSIRKPIATIIGEANSIASGDLTTHIVVNSSDEMGHMAEQLNNMVEQITHSFIGITSAVTHITAEVQNLYGLSNNLARGAEEQRTQSDQISIALNELSQLLQEETNYTTNVSEVTNESLETASAGEDVVKQTIESIQSLSNNTDEASEKIENLGKSLNEIDEIVLIITDIANQTNLLALNAAIEAARSGEHGRGFSVVADEVRKLAEKTTKATDMITNKIKNIQSQSEQSMETMHKGKRLTEETVIYAHQAGESLQKLVEKSKMVSQLVQQVVSGTQDQSTASEQVSQSMIDIKSIIDENASLASDVERASSILSDHAGEVMSLISYFKTSDQITINQNKEHAVMTES